MVTKITQLMDLFKRSAIDIGSFKQALPTQEGEQPKSVNVKVISQQQNYNRNEIYFNTLKAFEPAEEY